MTTQLYLDKYLFYPASVKDYSQFRRLWFQFTSTGLHKIYPPGVGDIEWIEYMSQTLGAESILIIMT